VLFVSLVLAGAVALPPLTSLPTIDRLTYTAKPVYCAGVRGRDIALTFDDGPSPYTVRLVRVLRRERARATFFVVGSRVSLWPDAVRAVSRVGVVGNHTWSHPNLIGLTPRAVRSELERTQWIVRRTIGATPSIFRPPYEQATPAQDRIVRSLRLLDVRWNVDSGDSRPGARPSAVVRAVAPRLRPGAIVLLHDPHPWTPAVARALVRAVRRRGLRLVTVPELLRRQPPSRHQLTSRGIARCPR
jgi:peptidoglycan/xylan/chitin deacetylase (PgdA/CDA1 family)